MRKIIFLVAFGLFILPVTINAEKAETFQQARELSAQTGKPILMEFVHDD
jgi:hypothetical protein